MTWASWKAPTGGPLQRFQAGNGCGQKDCAQTLGTAFWSRQNDGVLYVWDRGDVLRAYNFVNNRFVTTPAAVSAVRPGMTGGPSVSANGSDVTQRHRVGRHDSIHREAAGWLPVRCAPSAPPM